MWGFVIFIRIFKLASAEFCMVSKFERFHRMFNRSHFYLTAMINVRILYSHLVTKIRLLLLRGLVGFAIGCVPQSVTLYAEFLPTKQRAKCVVLLDVSSTC